MKQRFVFILFILVFFVTGAKCSVSITDYFNKTKDYFTGIFKKDKKKNKKSKIKKAVTKQKKKDIKKFNIFKNLWKKNVPKKTINILVDNEYLKTLDGKLLYHIVKDFHESENKYHAKITITDIKKANKKLKNTQYHIVLNTEYNQYQWINNKKYFSKNLFDKAFYFIAQSKNAQEFRYPSSIKKYKIGFIYQSAVHKYMEKKYGERNNYYFYRSFDSLLHDYKIGKIDLLIINRNDYLLSFRQIPGVVLFFFEQDETYGKICFTDKEIANSFDKYLRKKKMKEHDYIQYLKTPLEKLLLSFR